MKNSGEKVRISIQVPKELYEKVEEKAKKSFLGRSSWIIQAISEKISKEDQELSKGVD